MITTDGILPIVLIGIAVAILPFLALSVYVARGRGVLWKAFLFGWGVWLLAFLVRSPLLVVPQALFSGLIVSSVTLAILFGLYASILAGLFEEGLRFFILRRRKSLRIDRKSVLSFGLGWGVGEAIILYVPAVASIPLLADAAPSITEMILGAIERNLAILAHVSFTFIVLRAFSRGKTFLALAILLHFALNAIAVSTLILTENVLLTEAMIGIVVAISLIIAYQVRGEISPSNPDEKEPDDDSLNN